MTIGGQGIGPLSGYRIIEFGGFFTLPQGAVLLADQGADVIKVEAPSGDIVRYVYATRKGAESMSAAFATLNRNKRSIVLDMKKPEAPDVFRRLAAGADVVMQNFRPGVMERFGLGYDDLRKIKDDIIFVSVTGFGDDGPYADRRAIDPVIQASSGMAVAQRNPDTETPDTVKTALADKITGYVISQAVTAALLERERTGKGQHVRINMLEVMISFLWSDTMSNDTWLGDDVNVGGDWAYLRFIYETSDGYLLVTGSSDVEWQRLCDAIGKPELVADPRFATGIARQKHLKEQYRELKTSFLARTTDDWLALFTQLDVVCSPVNGPSDIHLDPHVVATGVLSEFDHPHAGRYRQPRHTIRFEPSVDGIRHHAPMLGEQTDEILREIGYGDEDIRAFRAASVAR